MIVVEDNLRLVHSVLARQFKIYPNTDEYDDYFQVGCEGLVMAAQRFKPELGYEFSTYAVSMIIGSIKRYRRDYVNGQVKVSRSVRELFFKVKRLDGLDDEVICEKLSITPQQLAECRLAMQIVLSIDAPIQLDGDKDIPMHEVIPDKADVEELAVNKALAGEVWQLLKQICTGTEMTVLKTILADKTQDEAGATAGISQVQASRLMKKIQTKYAKLIKEYMNGNKEPLLQIIKRKKEKDMSKLSEKHISVVADWMRNNPNETPNVSKLWRENNLEYLEGYQTKAKKKAVELLGVKVETKPIKVEPKIEPIAKGKNTTMVIYDEFATYQREDEPMNKPEVIAVPDNAKVILPYKPEPMPEITLTYTGVTSSNMQIVTDSIRRAICLGDSKAKIKVSVEYEG